MFQISDILSFQFNHISLCITESFLMKMLYGDPIVSALHSQEKNCRYALIINHINMEQLLKQCEKSQLSNTASVFQILSWNICLIYETRLF